MGLKELIRVSEELKEELKDMKKERMKEKGEVPTFNDLLEEKILGENKKKFKEKRILDL